MTAAPVLVAPVRPPTEREGVWWSQVTPRSADPGVVGLPVALWFTETHHAEALI